MIDKVCSPDLEYLMLRCRPFYLPREYTVVIVMAVYIPPQANVKVALEQLYDVISKQQNIHPDGIFIIAGDFNQAHLNTVHPIFYQHVKCKTRGENTLDHVYTNIKDAYKAIARPHLGQSDHLSLFLTPAYKALVNSAKSTYRIVKVWPEVAINQLQDCFENTDWNIFSHQSDLETFTSSVMSYIGYCVDNVTVNKKIRVYPNEKPWMDNEVKQLIRARDTAFKSGDISAYKVARASLKSGIRSAKLKYKQRIEEDFSNNSNPWRMWQGIRVITDYKKKNDIQHLSSNNNAYLAEELNSFFARFEKDNNQFPVHFKLTGNSHPLVLHTQEVRQALNNINTRKAAGPDGVHGRVLQACAYQLAEVFTNIFNLSLSLCKVPTCLKTTTIVPVPKKNMVTCLNDY
ncbi:uncharacterized protein LOC127495187 isoform X2 [Ctenopharyngodon idella]|uniref:uncharacterized protein LOC127495187 isoform X2 n=1 Tax=Ctenopharyngodon idella TaxID=7959 RepID=UPI00222E4CD0|nr:uncharacterized protein LOC127495187 isoform X2 [Ctenopharyngodon idella]